MSFNTSTIIYTCPECGSDLQNIVLFSMPPQYKKVCDNCGWEHIEPQKEEAIRIPYQIHVDVAYSNDVCKNCSNHPSNGGSGICNCILGTPPITL